MRSASPEGQRRVDGFAVPSKAAARQQQVWTKIGRNTKSK